MLVKSLNGRPVIASAAKRSSRAVIEG